MHVRDFKTVKKGSYCLATIMAFLILNNMDYAQDEGIIIGNIVRMQSKFLEKEIQLSIHLPDDYNSSDERYPVLYTFQTHFEQVSGAAKNLYDYGLIPKIIIVRIDNYEYGYLSPMPVEDDPNSGKADLFLRFFKENLYPFIDSKYRTHPYRIVFSNSWGAMFAAYAILTKPDIFNAAIASIPWITFDGENRYMINNVEEFLTHHKYHNFLYMSMDNESVTLPDLDIFINVLKKIPKQGLEWEYHYWPEEDHTSTPYRSIFSGLRSIFKEWNQIPPDVASMGLSAIKKHEASLNKKFGYEIGISIPALRAAGRQHRNSKNYKEAIAIYKYVIEKRPNDAFAYIALGQVYEENSQLKLAKEAYEEAYRIAESTSHPQLKWIKNFLDRIRKKTGREKKDILASSTTHLLSEERDNNN